MMIKKRTQHVAEKLLNVKPEEYICMNRAEKHRLEQAVSVLERGDMLYNSLYPDSNVGYSPYFRAIVEIKECLE